MDNRWRRWLPPTLAMALFALLSLLLLPYAGIEEDEVFFSFPLYAPGSALFNAHFFGHAIPLMALSYLGSLKTWIYAVVFSLAAPSRWSVRLPMVIVGVATIWLTWMWVRRIAGARAAAFTIALLSTDSIFILTNTLDWGPVAFQHVFLMGGLVVLNLWRERGGHKWLILAFFLWGLGLWDKALMVWLLIALAVAVVCVYPRELWRVLRPKPVAIAALGLVMGALPLVWYNVALHGATATSNTRLSIGSLPNNFSELQLVVRGDVLFDAIASTTSGPIERKPAGMVERFSIAVSHYSGSPKTRPLALALILSVIAWLVLIRRPEGRLLLFIALVTAVAWLQMAANAGTGSGAHHVILLWPFPCAFIGIALASASERFPKPARWAVTALIAWFAFANLLNTNEYLATFIRKGATTAWTDASERLAGAISHYRDNPIVSVDWGYDKVLRMFYGGELNLILIDDGNRMRVDYATRPDAIFIQHTEDRQIIQGVNDKLRSGAAALGYAEKTLRIVHDDEGREIFEIFQFVKSTQPAR